MNFLYKLLQFVKKKANKHSSFNEAILLKKRFFKTNELHFFWKFCFCVMPVNSHEKYNNS